MQPKILVRRLSERRVLRLARFQGCGQAAQQRAARVAAPRRRASGRGRYGDFEMRLSEKAMCSIQKYTFCTNKASPG